MPSLIEAKSTTEALDLVLYLRQDRKVVGIHQGVPGVFEGTQQLEGFLESQEDAARRSGCWVVLHEACFRWLRELGPGSRVGVTFMPPLPYPPQNVP